MYAKCNCSCQPKCYCTKIGYGSISNCHRNINIEHEHDSKFVKIKNSKNKRKICQGLGRGPLDKYLTNDCNSPFGGCIKPKPNLSYNMKFGHFKSTTTPAERCTTPLEQNYYSNTNQNKIRAKSNEINGNKYEFTEQRCNYERLALMANRVPKQPSLVACDCHNISSSPTYAGCLMNEKFCHLRDFRLQNIDACFSERRQNELRLKSLTNADYAGPMYDNDYCTIELNKMGVQGQHKTSNQSSTKKTNTTTPYPFRQLQWRERLQVEVNRNKKKSKIVQQLGLSPSYALIYQEMY